MDLDIATLRDRLETEADPERAERMAAYLKDNFWFLGVPSPVQRAEAKPFLAAAGKVGPDELIEFVDRCWDQPEREFQQIGCLVLRRWIYRLGPGDLDQLRRYVTTKSWWDTVDSLAAWSVGPLVRSHPELSRTMDRWIDDGDMWLARTAILHQLSYKEATDQRRLFAYARRRADDTEFFIRKAIGWALRQYAREDPQAVREFVAANADRLSGLSKREALKHIGP